MGTTATGARFVDNLEPGDGEALIVENLPFGWHYGAWHAQEADEQIIAHLQVLARGGGCRGGRLVVSHLLPGSGLVGLPSRPLGGLLRNGLGGLLGSSLASLPSRPLGGLLSSSLAGLSGSSLMRT